MVPGLILGFTICAQSGVFNCSVGAISRDLPLPCFSFEYEERVLVVLLRILLIQVGENTIGGLTDRQV